jgi:hypothetical protein
MILNSKMHTERTDAFRLEKRLRKRGYVTSTLPTVLRWVHTSNVTAYRNAVTLQVTDTIRSYELNFHPVPHGVTVFCKRYTLRFPVCYLSPSDVVTASSGFVRLYILRFKEKERR